MHLARVLALVVACAVAACDPPSRSEQECLSTVDAATATSPAPNTLRVRGTIADNESVLVRYTSGAEVRTVVGTASGSDIVFSPLSSGTVTLVFVVSCEEADQKEYPPITRTIS